MWKNGLIRKIRLISELMRSQHGKQIIAIQMLLSISRSEGNEICSVNRVYHEKHFT